MVLLLERTSNSTRASSVTGRPVAAPSFTNTSGCGRLRASTVRRNELALRQLAGHARTAGWHTYLPAAATRVRVRHQVPYVFTDRTIGKSKMTLREAMGYVTQLRQLYGVRFLGSARGRKLAYTRGKDDGRRTRDA